MIPLAEWQNFYVIVGSAAGALTGLQFVVMALMADLPRMEAESDAVSVFSTPSIVNFGVVLLLAAVHVMPWHTSQAISIVWAIVGVLGIIYTLLTGWRFRKQQAYKPVFEDYLYRVILPTVGYGAVAAAALVMRANARAALFEVGAAVLLLLFTGIHDAWDNATFLVFYKRGEIDPKNPK
jgi:cation transport ATPase